MNSHVHRFYRKFADEQAPIRLYHEVVTLHEEPRFSWEEISAKAPSLSRGWYELSQLPLNDRIEFTRDFWLTTLPYVPHVDRFLRTFFDQIDDVGVYLTQVRYDSAFESELVYSLGDESCFYHGAPPCSEKKIQGLQQEYEGNLPEDFLAFLKIHDGFSKHTDTGIIKTENMHEVRSQLITELQQLLLDINPLDLIPFYESFGGPVYQCFLLSWMPEGEPGNVLYASHEKKISDFKDRNHWQQNLAFPTFLDWLIFYLEGV